MAKLEQNPGYSARFPVVIRRSRPVAGNQPNSLRARSCALLRRWNFASVRLNEANLNISTTCEFGNILEVFPWCFRKFKVKKYKGKLNKLREKQTNKRRRKKKSLCGFRVLRSKHSYALLLSNQYFKILSKSDLLEMKQNLRIALLITT